MTRTPRRRGPRGGGDETQLHIEWADPPANAPVVPPPAAPERGHVPPRPAPSGTQDAPLLVQRLPWDFGESFPEPTPEAVEAGVLSDEDAETENLRALHDEYGREALAVLKSLDAVGDARRRGIDPATGKPPRTPATRERLRKWLEAEPQRLERWWTTLMDTYESAFGPEAAEAFAKALRARHAGVEVVADAGRMSALPTSPEVKESGIGEQPAVAPTPTRRHSTRLPVPRPLPAAVAAGRFGEDEDGRHVHPGPQEVRAITEQHAEKLAELLRSSCAARGSRIPTERPQHDERYAAGLAAYAEDFGTAAAEQLDAHVRRTVSREHSPTGSRGRRR